MNDLQSTVLCSKENISNADKLKAKKLVDEGKILASQGELYKSLKYFKKAYSFFPKEKILSRIKVLEEAISQEEEEEEDFGFIELDNGLVIYKKLVERLYPHQIEGVKWMYDLYTAKKKGGILADDMGLGKTIQIISFISAMFDMKQIKNTLLVLPLSVIPNWIEEFKNWAPGIRVECFTGPTAKRKAALHHCMTKRSVCITTYGLILTQWQALSQTISGREFVWDYIILDEGHRIKNPSKTTKSLHCVPSRNRLILTGTPVQNRVRDLWALLDWVTQGSLLGTKKTFRSDYELPIERARQRDASAAEIQLGNHMAESLRKLTTPYILRRTKDGLMIGNKENCPDEDKVAVDEKQDKSVLNIQPSFPKLSTKNDFVVWVYLSEVQQKIYKDFIQLDSVKALLSSHRSPLVYLTILKKICDHPRLLSNKACRELGLESNDSFSKSEDNAEEAEDCAANRIDNISDETLIEESGKLQFLIELLLRLREEGHRTLVFSMSRKMLNIIQRILLNKKFKIMRLDGLVTKLSEREKRVNLFQDDPTYNIFLLTTQVGGVGLTLTGADRVVIYDPSWNPATDAQAVDRIYRIGQKKSVAVYRLITCGSVEEKIYRRQIFKNSVIQQSTGESKDPYRYFTRQDLAELFSLDDVTSSATQQQLENLHGSQRNLDEKLQEHIDFVHTLKMFGISDHDLMFTRKPDDFDYEQQMADQCFNNKVEQAQNRLRVESDQFTGQDVAEQRWGAFNEPKPKDGNPSSTARNEPVYPIEGLNKRLDALSLPDDKVIKTEPLEDMSGSDAEFENDAAESSRGGWNVENSEDEAIVSIHSPHTPAPKSTTPSWDKPNLPSLDEAILVADSPNAAAEDGRLSRTSNNIMMVHDDDERPSPHTENLTFYNDEEADDLILAVDSPLPDLDRRHLTDDGTHRQDLPTEIQDSFTVFPESGSDDEEDHDESWREAFSAESPISSINASHPRSQNVSVEDSPMVAPGNRRRQVIESDSSDDEELAQLQRSYDQPSLSNSASAKHKRRSVNVGIRGLNALPVDSEAAQESDEEASPDESNYLSDEATSKPSFREIVESDEAGYQDSVSSRESYDESEIFGERFPHHRERVNNELADDDSLDDVSEPEEVQSESNGFGRDSDVAEADRELANTGFKLSLEESFGDDL